MTLCRNRCSRVATTFLVSSESSERQTRHAQGFDKKIDEQARSQWELPPERMQDVDRRGEHRYLRQHDIQSSGGKLVLDGDAHELRDANAFYDCLNQGLSIIAIEGAIGDDPRAVRKSKRLRTAAKQVAKAGMLREIVDRLRDSPPLKIFWRCAQNVLQDTQRATDQVCVFQLSNSDSEVETLTDEIDAAVCDAEVELNVRIALQERARPCGNPPVCRA